MSLFDVALITVGLSYFLPFLLIFVVILALMQKARIFGDPNVASVRILNTIFSLAVAAIVVFINPFGISWAVVLGKMLSTGSMLMIALGFLIIFVLMISVARMESSVGKLTLIISTALVLYMLSVSGLLLNFGFEMPQETDVYSLSALVILLGVIIGIAYLFGTPPKKKTT
jgi:hypothetical protein